MCIIVTMMLYIAQYQCGYCKIVQILSEEVCISSMCAKSELMYKQYVCKE